MDFADPEANILKFGLETGQSVADFGAGSGHYSIAAARAVGSSGRVYAIEVQKDLVARIKENARQEGVGNIEVVWGDIEENGGTKLRDNIVDRVILSNILFQVDDKEGTASEVNRLLRPQGKVYIVDWDGSYDNLGPAEEMVYTKDEARSLFEKLGYVYERDIDAGEHHYGFVMNKA